MLHAGDSRIQNLVSAVEALTASANPDDRAFLLETFPSSFGKAFKRNGRFKANSLRKTSRMLARYLEPLFLALDHGDQGVNIIVSDMSRGNYSTLGPLVADVVAQLRLVKETGAVDASVLRSWGLSDVTIEALTAIIGSVLSEMAAGPSVEGETGDGDDALEGRMEVVTQRAVSEFLAARGVTAQDPSIAEPTLRARLTSLLAANSSEWVNLSQQERATLVVDVAVHLSGEPEALLDLAVAEMRQVS